MSEIILARIFMRQLLQPIAAFVYCNRQVPPAGNTRRPAAGNKLNAPVNSAHDDTNTSDRQLKSTHGRSSAKLKLLWSPYVIGQTIIFSSCFFFFLLSFFSSPNLSGRRLDVYHTLAHGVALVRI